MYAISVLAYATLGPKKDASQMTQLICEKLENLYRMQGGVKNVGREPRWCRPNPEYHQPRTPLQIPS